MFTSYAFSEVIFCGSEQRKNMPLFASGVGPEFGAYLEIGVLALRNEEAVPLSDCTARRRWSSSRSHAIPLIGLEPSNSVIQPPPARSDGGFAQPMISDAATNNPMTMTTLRFMLPTLGIVDRPRANLPGDARAALTPAPRSIDVQRPTLLLRVAGKAWGTPSP